MKIKKEPIFGMVCSPGFWQFLCMAAGGGLSVAAANVWNRPYFVDIPVREVREEKGENFFLGQAEEAGESFEDMGDRDAGEVTVLSDGIREDGMAGNLEKGPEEDLPGRFNFAYYFDPDTEQKDGSQSYGGRVYQGLLNKDGSWMAEIYGLRRVSPEAMAARLGMDKSAVMGTRHLNGISVEEKAKAIPSWNRFQVTFRNGDGTAVMGHSNIKEILSVASVYGYFNQEQSYDFLQSYTDRLWIASHSFRMSVSDVYYCQGECLYGDDRGDLDGSSDQGEPWSEGGSDTQGISSQGDSSASVQGAGRASGSADGSQGAVSPASGAVDGSQGAALPGAGSGGVSAGAASPASGSLDGSQGTALPEAGSGDVPQEAVPSGAGSGNEGQEPATLPQGSDQGVLEPLPAAVSVGEASRENFGHMAQEPLPAAAMAEQDRTEQSPVQDNVLLQSETATGSGFSADNVQGQGQVSHEPIPETDGSGQGLGQTSHEPIPETGGGGQGLGQTSHEPIPETGGGGQGLGQASHEPIPASQTGQGESSASSESAVAVSESNPAFAAADSASEADGQENGRKVSDNKFCQGHIDLNVSAVILDMDGKKNLFTQAEANGSAGQKASSQGWRGWEEGAMEYARAIAKQDWYEEYGLTGQKTMFVHNPLSGSEVASYMAMLPQDTSQKRRKVAEQALLSIGCIPYYWGGKPSGPGFENNHFGAVISPDEDGRIMRGLDCSGWINWVYWTTFGSSLPAESTSGLMSCGKAVEKKDLKAGDILIRAGDQPHVYLFLAWAQDGSMYLIHETTGNVNNVTIGVYDLDLPYYRCLIDEG